MGLFQNVLKSGNLIRVGHQIQGISYSLCHFPKAFSTAAEGMKQDSPSNLAVTYGRLSGIPFYTTKIDIQYRLKDCNVTLEDIKAMYNPNFTEVSMLIRFPSLNAYDDAMKLIDKERHRAFLMEGVTAEHWEAVSPYDRKVKLLKGIPRTALQMTRVTAEHWEAVSCYNGKAVLLQGIPLTAGPDDIDCFLLGCQHNSTTIFTRYIKSEYIKMAIVQFPSSSLALSAYLSKNGTFCLNNCISFRVLQ